MQRPQYKDYLNQAQPKAPTHSYTPYTPQKIPSFIHSPNKKHLEDTAHTEKEPTITIIQDKSILKEMKGF